VFAGIEIGSGSGNDRINNLFVMNKDGTNRVVIHQAERLGSPSWAPDRSAIAFLVGPNTVDKELWTIDFSIVNGVPQGNDATRRATNAYYVPSWSPLGDKISYVGKTYDSTLGYDTPRELNVLYTSDWSSETLYTAPEGNRIVYTTFSGDGSKIAFREQSTNPTQYWLSVYDTSDDTMDTAVYGPVGYSFSHLDWSSTGTEIAFAGIAPDDRTAIYIIDTADENPTPQFLVGGESTAPSWSPNDDEMAYLQGIFKGGKFKGYDIYIHNFASETNTKVSAARDVDWVGCETCP
jgi:Tol biopolymer transport system component